MMPMLTDLVMISPFCTAYFLANGKGGAAFSKLEYEYVNTFKHKRRELVIDEEDQKSYEDIAHRDPAVLPNRAL